MIQFRSVHNPLDCRRCGKLLIKADMPVAPPQSKMDRIDTPISDGTLNVGFAVSTMRHLRNMSQNDLSGKMDVPRTYISKIENGNSVPTLASLNRFAVALDVTLWRLVQIGEYGTL